MSSSCSVIYLKEDRSTASEATVNNMVSEQYMRNYLSLPIFCYICSFWSPFTLKRKVNVNLVNATKSTNQSGHLLLSVCPNKQNFKGSTFSIIYIIYRCVLHSDQNTLQLQSWCSLIFKGAFSVLSGPKSEPKSCNLIFPWTYLHPLVEASGSPNGWNSQAEEPKYIAIMLI